MADPSVITATLAPGRKRLTVMANSGDRNGLARDAVLRCMDCHAAMSLGPSSSGRTIEIGICAVSLGVAKGLRRDIAALTRRAAKPEPQTKRMTGPNVPAAGRPTKNKPGAEDSKDRERRGQPATVWTLVQEIRSEKTESFQIDAVTRGGEDMINLQLGSASSGQRQRHLVAIPDRSQHGVPIQNRDPALHPVTKPPGAEWSEHLLHQLDTGPPPGGT